MLVADFEHFLEKGKPLQLASAEPATLSAWLHEATGLSVSLPGIDDAQGQIVGARKCKLAGRPAAFALYEMNGTPASLIVMPAEGIDLEAMQQVRDGPHMHWMDRRDGHTVLACKRGDLLYAAVSTLGEDRLAVLMTDGTPRD
jgi:anti-sigma factor RsiW